MRSCSRKPAGTSPCAAVRLRNILVHGYLDIDHGRLYDELGWIDDAAELAALVERWLRTNVDGAS